MTWTPSHDAEHERTLAHNGLQLSVESVGGAVIFDHDRPVEELNRETIRFAADCGWRGANAEDFREIRRILTVAYGEADYPYWHPSADEDGLSEALGFLADEAIEWLNDHVAPAGTYIDNDGEVGALGCWPIHPAARCQCMTEDPGDGWGERVLVHSARCPLHPEHDGTDAREDDR